MDDNRKSELATALVTQILLTIESEKKLDLGKDVQKYSRYVTEVGDLIDKIYKEISLNVYRF